MKKKLLFIINNDEFFVSHRLPIGLAALKQNFDVHIMAKFISKKKLLENYGFKLHHFNLSRTNSNFIFNLINFFQILRLFFILKPDIVHLITIKPIIFGGIAARIASVKSVVVAISGLGHVYISTGFLSRVRIQIVNFLYSLSLNHKNLIAIFQNLDDRNYVIKNCYLDIKKTIIIHGSGIDLDKFKPQPFPSGKPIVSFIARLIKDKGIYEFIKAAKLLKLQEIDVRFVIVGNIDPDHPGSITQIELNKIISEELVEYWGFRDDISEVIAQSTIVALPSYREGLPKTLIEASAGGRPVVTTDVPGCRDAILNNETGFLVPIKDASSLAESLKVLLTNRFLCENFGLNARNFAVSKFDINKVVKRHLEIYNNKLSDEKNTHVL